MQALVDLRTRKLSPGKNLQKLKDLQAGNKKKEVRDPQDQCTLMLLNFADFYFRDFNRQI